MSIVDIDLLPSTVLPGNTNHVQHHSIIHTALKELKSLMLSETEGSVKLSGDQTVDGIKTFSSSPIVPTPTTNTQAANKGYVDTLAASKEPSITAGTTTQYWRGDKVWATLNKAAVGLGSVDNTTDAAKPISNAAAAALLLKADKTAVVELAGEQTISGTKTFSAAPKLLSTSTVGNVWTATATDGAGAWQPSATGSSTVDWANILNKPATFAPTIGTTSTTAAAGNHTHTKSELGLGNVDNTSDLAKPISTATQTALNARVSTSRTISTTGPLSGGGALTGDLTLTVGNSSVGLTHLSTAAKSEAIPFVHSSDTRKVGAGDLAEGLYIHYPITITSIRYRMGTADASGTTTVELRKNDVAVSGTSGSASVSPTAITGSWSFAAGDILTVHITAVGTTPGKRLTVDMLGVKA